LLIQHGISQLRLKGSASLNNPLVLMISWWEGFFDAEYLRLWEGGDLAGDADRQVAGLHAILDLKPGANVLDAPCGYGRISKPLAEQGARVLGVDYSSDMLVEAERRRGSIPREQLRYVQHDLRMPLRESGFDVALNLFSSLGYGTEADDLAILTTLRTAVRPSGLVFIETNHRDRIIADFRGRSSGQRLRDGTILLEESRFDPVAGRVETTWYWSGPSGSGEKRASIRIYTVTELVKLVEQADLHLRSVHRGCFPDPFVSDGAPVGGRLGLLAEREK
jgi:SAM-dependent methyltransferase